MGATGTGKTARATELARQTGAPVVVLDRFQVFEDLGTGTGRPLPHEIAGTTRLYLARRYMMDGEFSAEQATLAFLRTVGALVEDHDLILLEGGSVALYEMLMEEELLGASGVTVERTRWASVPSYEYTLRRRAQAMLKPGGGRRSMIEEVARGWDDPRMRAFLATITGYDAIIAHCEQSGMEPAELSGAPLDAMLVEEVVLSHLRYAARQNAALNRLFGDASFGAEGSSCTA
ncbi:isopentenyl transferase [Chondromyces apiculatus DSM 436]|uniref:Isopentenyl transferase n=1 Tax=Chondromyces apiculatus DSM 436 TaxID=1192034 RepID=A0A017T245_9BACT|nr:isopentenyl transferase [Chondromyces apiculatus DSM 436]